MTKTRRSGRRCNVGARKSGPRLEFAARSQRATVRSPALFVQEIVMSITNVQLSDAGARIRIEELAKAQDIEGITSDEAEQLLDLTHQTASARFSDLRVD